MNNREDDRIKRLLSIAQQPQKPMPVSKSSERTIYAGVTCWQHEHDEGLWVPLGHGGVEAPQFYRTKDVVACLVRKAQAAYFAMLALETSDGRDEHDSNFSLTVEFKIRYRYQHVWCPGADAGKLIEKCSDCDSWHSGHGE